MATPRQRNLGAVGLAAAVVVGFVLMGPSGLCAEINNLIDESASDFDSQQGVLLSESMRQWSSSFEMEGSSSCSMFLDIERSGHLCTWEYWNADGSGPVAYDETVANVRACLDGAAESEDPRTRLRFRERDTENASSRPPCPSDAGTSNYRRWYPGLAPR